MPTEGQPFKRSQLAEAFSVATNSHVTSFLPMLSAAWIAIMPSDLKMKVWASVVWPTSRRIQPSENGWGHGFLASLAAQSHAV